MRIWGICAYIKVKVNVIIEKQDRENIEQNKYWLHRGSVWWCWLSDVLKCVRWFALPNRHNNSNIALNQNVWSNTETHGLLERVLLQHMRLSILFYVLFYSLLYTNQPFHVRRRPQHDFSISCWFYVLFTWIKYVSSNKKSYWLILGLYASICGISMACIDL